MNRDHILMAINKKMVVVKRQRDTVSATEAEIEVLRKALAEFDRDQGKLDLAKK